MDRAKGSSHFTIDVDDDGVLLLILLLQIKKERVLVLAWGFDRHHGGAGVSINKKRTRFWELTASFFLFDYF